MTSDVSIVIPTWNGLDLLKRFQPSVIAAAQRYTEKSNARAEVVIVDDGSTDSTVDWLRSREFSGIAEEATSQPSTDVGLKFVRSEAKRGFGEACNRGFEAARYPLVFLLNNDVEVDADSIAPLVENFADESVFAAHCRVFNLKSGRECGTGKLGSFARGFIRVHRSYAPVTSSTSSHAALFSMFAGGGSAMFDREKFLAIGGFDPLLSPFYWEDVELSYRAWKRGLTILYEPRSVTRHRISSTIGKLNQRSVRRIEQRNRLVYQWIHLHDRRMLASHILWVALLGIVSLPALRFEFIPALIAALKLLPKIRERRREELQAARRSDRDVFRIFSELEKRNDVIAFDDFAELDAAHHTIGAVS